MRLRIRSSPLPKLLLASSLCFSSGLRPSCPAFSAKLSPWARSAADRETLQCVLSSATHPFSLSEPRQFGSKHLILRAPKLLSWWALRGGGSGVSSLSMSEVDVERVRAETRGCQDGAVHFNNAGAALMPACVSDAYTEYIRQEEIDGGYETAASREKDLESFYHVSAKLLNCKASEIAFVESASRGWALAFYSLPMEKGDRILTSAADYGSNFVAYLQARDKHGAEIIVIPDDANGEIDLAVLEKEASHKRAKVISVSHIPTGGGTILPAKEIGIIAKKYGLPYILDACQSVGQIPVDVQEIGCDVLGATGRKFLRGPRGTGLLYVREEFLHKLEPVMLDQYSATLLSETQYDPRPDARRFEMWEYNFGGKVALGVAIAYALEQKMESIGERSLRLAQRLRQGLAELEGVSVTDVGNDLCAIVTFVVDGVNPPEVKKLLAESKIRCSTSAASGGGSRVWYDRRKLTEVVRVSPHYYNTEQEVDRCIAAVRQIKEQRSLTAKA